MQVKAQRRRTPSSCFSACFGSHTALISDDVLVPAEVLGAGLDRKISWFSWSRLTKKKKKKMMTKTTSLLEPLGEVSSTTSASTEVSAREINSRRPAKGRSIQVPLAQTIHANNEIQQVRIPQISPKFNGNLRRAPSTTPPQNNASRSASPNRSRDVTRLRPKSGKLPRQGKLGTGVGLSVVAITLVVMLIWGRACAVMCLCCFFYLLPLLGTVENDYTNSVDAGTAVDMESEKYKQQVILKGLLQRNGRRVTPAPP